MVRRHLVTLAAFLAQTNPPALAGRDRHTISRLVAYRFVFEWKPIRIPSMPLRKGTGSGDVTMLWRRRPRYERDFTEKLKSWADSLSSSRLDTEINNVFADSDEFARAFRDDVARDYEMMSPGSAPRWHVYFSHWVGVGQASRRCSVASISAGWNDGGQFVEVEFDDRL